MPGFSQYQPPQSSLADTMRRLGYTYGPNGWTYSGAPSASYEPGPSAPSWGGGNIPSGSGPTNPTAGTPTTPPGNNPSAMGGGGSTQGFGNNVGTYLQIAEILGKYFSGRAQGQAQGAVTEADLERQNNAAHNQNVARTSDIDLQRRIYQNQAAPNQAQSAALGDLMANVKDVNIQTPPWVSSHVPQISGGLRPSALGPNARAAGSALSSQSLDRLQNPSPFPALDFRDTATPELNGGQSNLGSILQLAAALGGLYQNRG